MLAPKYNKIILLVNESILDNSLEEYIKDFKHEIGCIKMLNRLLSSSTGKLSIVLKSDTIVSKNWIGKLCSTASFSNVGIIEPVSQIRPIYQELTVCLLVI